MHGDDGYFQAPIIALEPKTRYGVVDTMKHTEKIDRMDDTIYLQEAIDAVHKNYDAILDFKSDGQTISSSIEDILSELPSARLTREEFENELQDMFGHIWGCEIDHPIFQDTVGDIMEAVISLVYNNHTGKKVSND